MTLEEKLKVFQENIKHNPLTSVIITIILLLLLLIVVPYFEVNNNGINNATVETTLVNQYRNTYAQILGGAAVLFGLYFAWGNLTTAREGQITERFTQAVNQLGATDQLGNPAIEIRLGGIYALRRIANESEKDYWSIMEILTAYVRKNSPFIGNSKLEVLKSTHNQVGDTQDAINIRTQCMVSPDVDAIIKIIRKGKSFFLYGKNEEHLDLQRAYLWNINLSEAFLDACSFEGTFLQLVNFRNTQLPYAYFVGAILINADLRGANLKQAEFLDANLQGANLQGANLRGAKNLTFDQLSEVETLYKAQLDEGLEAELRAEGYSHLLDVNLSDEP